MPIYIEDLFDFESIQVQGEMDKPVRNISADSRQIQEGDLFFAIRGYQSDGHRFIDQAIQNGACAVVVDQTVSDIKVPVIRVADSRTALAGAASRFYGRPADAMKMLGVTGTNGKTTVACLLESILSAAGLKTGLIGTITYRWPGHEEAAERTTPDIIQLHQMLASMRKDGVQAVVMEVSSHALYLHRVDGIQFQMAVYTNLSREHMDFHKNMDEYAQVKSRLFHMLAGEGRALINGDDPMAPVMIQAAGKYALTFGIENKRVDFRISDIRYRDDRTDFTIKRADKTHSFSTHLPGRFNVMNAAAAAVSGLLFPLDPEKVRKGLLAVKSVDGRMDGFMSDRGSRVIVDYAHTPDALENVLKACREFTENHLILVFGCGGDRDRGKRSQMGSLAEAYADAVYVTSDNPRTENPDAIIQDITEGIRSRANIIVETDRQKAICLALKEAGEGDTVLIAGKGHETYQEINHVKHPFDDKKTARSCLKALSG